MPEGHPQVRSFLGAPLLSRDGQVLGGLLLGHDQPNRFSESDEVVLRALAAQAAVALENASLYQAAQDQAEELATVFDSIADAVVVYDPDGRVAHENQTAARYAACCSVALTPTAMSTLTLPTYFSTAHPIQPSL